MCRIGLATAVLRHPVGLHMRHYMLGSRHYRLGSHGLLCQSRHTPIPWVGKLWHFKAFMQQHPHTLSRSWHRIHFPSARALIGLNLWGRWQTISGESCLFRVSAYVTKTIIVQRAGLSLLTLVELYPGLDLSSVTRCFFHVGISVIPVSESYSPIACHHAGFMILGVPTVD